MLQKQIPDQVTKIYTSISRPVLEYTSPVWSPWLQTDIKLLEATQKRALSLSTTEIQLESLENRRERAQLIEVYKLLSGLYKTTPERMFAPYNYMTNRLGIIFQVSNSPADQTQPMRRKMADHNTFSLFRSANAPLRKHDFVDE